MKREFLTELGIEKELIDKIMAENGNDINSYKEQINAIKAENETLKEKEKTFNETLEKFKDYDQVKGEVEIVKQQMLESNKAYESKIADMTFNANLEKALTKSGARNSKAVMGLLDIDTLKASKNQDNDIASAIENVKKDNDYLFTSDEPIKNFVKGSNSSKNSDPLYAIRQAMGLSDSKDKK